MSDHKPLITKFRPSDFSEFVGHEALIKALERRLQRDDRPHSYLFTGPAGTGKTSMARVVAKSLGCEINEIDAASNNGIDNMRELVEVGNHMSMMGNGKRAFIIDEVHGLSRQAFQAILKIIEEPPDHLFLMLCTTEAHKVPATIVSRCYHVTLKPLPPQEIEDLLIAVTGAQGWEVKDEVLAVVVQNCNGSPRLALSLLDKVWDLDTAAEAKRVTRLTEGSEPLIELMRLLLSGKDWSLVQSTLSRIEDEDFEEAGLIGGRYIAAVLLKPETKAAAARRLSDLLNALSFPTSSYDPKVNFIAAICRYVFGE